MIGAQTAQAGFTGGNPFFATGIPRVDFGDQKDLIALALNRLANHLFRPALGIHLGGINQR